MRKNLNPNWKWGKEKGAEIPQPPSELVLAGSLLVHGDDIEGFACAMTVGAGLACCSRGIGEGMGFKASLSGMAASAG